MVWSFHVGCFLLQQQLTQFLLFFFFTALGWWSDEADDNTVLLPLFVGTILTRATYLMDYLAGSLIYVHRNPHIILKVMLPSSYPRGWHMLLPRELYPVVPRGMK